MNIARAIVGHTIKPGYFRNKKNRFYNTAAYFVADQTAYSIAYVVPYFVTNQTAHSVPYIATYFVANRAAFSTAYVAPYFVAD
jgi:hypothetical protein